MPEPSRNSKVLRLLLLGVLGGWMIFSPAPRQLFGHGGSWAPRWTMFTDVGTEVCTTGFLAPNGEEFERRTHIRPKKPVNPPQTARLRTHDTWAVHLDDVCRSHQDMSRIDADMYCPGARNERVLFENACEDSR